MGRWPLALALLAACGDNAPPRGTQFTKRVIDPAFRSEGVTVFDVNHDGFQDIVTEELWYSGPAFEPHEVRTPRQWDPLTEYAHCFGAFHMDVDHDGFDDLIVFGPPGEDVSWCANPRGADRHWDCHLITAMSAGESPFLADVFGTGTTSIVTGVLPDQVFAWLEPGADPTQPWIAHPLTSPGFPLAGRFVHGLGFGDVNGDGRPDRLTGSGWLEQPADSSQTPWPFHAVDICPNNCAHMFAFDFDGDGLADLVGSSPHNYGVSWWHQERDGSFTQHEIDHSVSQTHALRIADFDGDGLPELVTGKRWLAHFLEDPGGGEDPLLVMYKPTGGAGGVAWTRYVLDDDSGIGSQFEIVDIDRDEHPDIVVANKKGLTSLAWTR